MDDTDDQLRIAIMESLGYQNDTDEHDDQSLHLAIMESLTQKLEPKFQYPTEGPNTILIRFKFPDATIRHYTIHKDESLNNVIQVLQHDMKLTDVRLAIQGRSIDSEMLNMSLTEYGIETCSTILVDYSNITK